MVRVVRAEFQPLKDVGHHAAVMPLVGIPDHRSQCGPVAWARALGLLDQITQGLFADHRKDDIAHDPVRLLEGGAGKLEQGVFAPETRQIVEVAIDLALGARRCGGWSRSEINRSSVSVGRGGVKAGAGDLAPPDGGAARRGPRQRHAADTARVRGEAPRQTDRPAAQSRGSAPAWPTHPERWPGSACPDRRATTEAVPAPFPPTVPRAGPRVRSRPGAAASPAALVSPDKAVENAGTEPLIMSRIARNDAVDTIGRAARSSAPPRKA